MRELFNSQLADCKVFSRVQAGVLASYGIFNTKPKENDRVFFVLVVSDGVKADDVIEGIDLALCCFLERDFDRLEKGYRILETKCEYQYPVLIKKGQ